MKTFGLVLAMVVVLASASFATVVTFDTFAGYETVSCPVVPFNPEPSSVFNGLDFENMSPGLSRWDAVTKGWVTYDFWSQPDTNFGGILLGDGYLTWNDTGGTVINSVDGVPDGVPDINNVKTDMWISLPKAGFTLIGHPFNTPVVIDQDTGGPIMFTDGTQMLRWDAAVSAGWVGDVTSRFNGVSWVGCGWNYYDEDTFQPGSAYYIYTNVDNLAMIIPAP